MDKFISYYAKKFVRLALIPGSLYGLYYLGGSYIAHSNQKAYVESEELTRDTTRPGNKSYGLNYGYKADNAVEALLDSGDIIFIKQNCLGALNRTDITKCYMNSFMKQLVFWKN